MMVLHWQEGDLNRGSVQDIPQLPPGTIGGVQMTGHGHLGRENAIWRSQEPENGHPYAGEIDFPSIYREVAEQPSWESF